MTPETWYQVSKEERVERKRKKKRENRVRRKKNDKKKSEKSDCCVSSIKKELARLSLPLVLVRISLDIGNTSPAFFSSLCLVFTLIC